MNSHGDLVSLLKQLDQAHEGLTSEVRLVEATRAGLDGSLIRFGSTQTNYAATLSKFDELQRAQSNAVEATKMINQQLSANAKNYETTWKEYTETRKLFLETHRLLDPEVRRLVEQIKAAQPPPVK